jgi:hypothetical protein
MRCRGQPHAVPIGNLSRRRKLQAAGSCPDRIASQTVLATSCHAFRLPAAVTADAEGRAGNELGTSSTNASGSRVSGGRYLPSGVRRR